MDTVDPHMTVGAVLNQSKSQGSSSSLMLAYTKDIRGFTQDTTLEGMLINDHLDKIVTVIKSLEQTIERSFKGIAQLLLTTRQMSRSNVMNAKYRDVTPTGLQEIEAPRVGVPAVVDHSVAVQRSDTTLNGIEGQVEAIVAYLQQTKDYTGEIAFYARLNSRDMEAFLKGGGQRDVTPKFEPSPKKKPDEKSHEGIFDWLMDTLGVSTELGMLTGFFKKLKSRLSGTFKNIGNGISKAVSFVTETFGSIGKWVGEIGGSIYKVLGGEVLNAKVSSYFGMFKNVVSGVFDKVFGPITTKFSSYFGLIKNTAGGIFEKISKSGFGKVAGKAFSALGEIGGKVFGPIARLAEGAAGKSLAKLSGLTIAKAIPFVGWAITAIMAVKDAGNALQDAKRITGKSKEFLGLGDKLNVGLSGILSGLTLGLVDPKTIYKFVTIAEEGISSALTSVFKMFPAPLQKAMSAVYDSLFDRKTGVFGGLMDIIEGFTDKLGNGDWAGAFMDAMLFVPRGIISLVKRLGSKIIDEITGNSPEGKGVMESVWDMMKSMFIAMKDWAVGGIKEFASHPLESIKNTASNAWSSLTDEKYSMRQARVQSVQDKVDSINKMLTDGDSKGANSAFSDLQSFVNNNSLAKDPAFQQAVANKVQTAQLAVKTGQPQTSMMTSSATAVDTQQAMGDSKSRLDDNGQSPNITVNPVVQSAPAPQQPTAIVRRSEGSMDQKLAFANYSGG